MKCYKIVWDWASVYPNEAGLHYEFFTSEFRNEDHARTWARQEAKRQEQNHPGSTWGVYDVYEVTESECT